MKQIFLQSLLWIDWQKCNQWPKYLTRNYFELEILRTDDSKEEITYFTELFYDLLSLSPNHSRKNPLIFLMRPFENIAKLGERFSKTQTWKMNGNRGSNTSSIWTEPFWTIQFNVWFESEIVVNHYKKYILIWKELTDLEKTDYRNGSQNHTEAMHCSLVWKNKKLSTLCALKWNHRVSECGVKGSGKKTKHEKLRNFAEGRFKCTMVRQINNNKISKDNKS
jgi:hypothetical protein